MVFNVSNCPVPDAQQPLNEYRALQKSCFFSWALRPLVQLLQAMGCIWGISWIISGPIAAASFLPSQHLGKFLLIGAAGASVPVVFMLLHLYLSWRYVAVRLSRPTVCYEESGWFDGQVWHKPEEVIVRDRLVFTYEVQPLLKRLKQTFLTVGLCVLSGMIVWQFL